MRVLLVEDDLMMGQALKRGLSQAGYVVDWLEDAESAESALTSSQFDLILLDVNLPKQSGLELISRLRKRNNSTPTLLLTARDTTDQKIEGLNSGADDYMVKPFDLGELIARLNALLRRSHGHGNPIIRHGDIAIDSLAKLVTKKNKRVELSVKEFSVLQILIENSGKILDKTTIEDKLYGWNTEIDSNAVEVYVSMLRKKLGSNLIRTIRGLGYIVEKIA